MGNSASVKKKNKANEEQKPNLNSEVKQTNNISESTKSPQKSPANMASRGGNPRGKFQEVNLKKSENHQTDQITQSNTKNVQQNTKNTQPSRTEDSAATAESLQRKAEARDAGYPSAPAARMRLEGDEIVFETFIKKDGREFQCLYTGGMRFYLDDWHSKEWQPFPHRWYNEGRFVTGDILQDERQAQNTATNQSNQRRATSQSDEPVQQTRSDDREGIIVHPKRGKIRTYLFKERHYVHCFFDTESGEWMRLPLGWELHHDLVKEMVDQVEDALPSWKNRPHILAALRVCNYNPDECISLYLHLENDIWLNPPKTSQEANSLKLRDLKIKDLEKRLADMERKFVNEEKLRKDAEAQVLSLQEKLSALEAKSGMAVAQVEAMQQTRPRTARPKTPKKARGVMVQEDLDSLNMKTTEIHKSHSQLKMTVERQLEVLKGMMVQATESAKRLSESDAGHLKELEEIRTLYQRESLERKLLFNQLQELRGNIRVFCRPRRDDKVQSCLSFPTDNELLCSSAEGSKKTFSFDKVYKTTASQEEVFADTKPVITSCADGYNVCLMAYGQTGSGKTFTMMGPENNPGINIRALTELVDICSQRKDTKAYEMKISMVEIYNETVIDLLDSNGKQVDLKVIGNNVRLPGLTELPIATVEEVKDVMKTGDENRSVASTKMNSTSSRSHLILMLTIEGKDKVNNAVSKGMLTLCDLAGSERIGKTEASGQRLIEAAAINKSLSALGQVFTSLRTSQMHIPYRNSKLTQILRPCLGGDAKACVFVNISPDNKNFAETCNTLEFGANARQVALGQAKQNVKRMRD